MKVNFENCDIEVYKLREGTVLQHAESLTFMHLKSFKVYSHSVSIKVLFYDGTCGTYPSDKITWLESH